MNRIKIDPKEEVCGWFISFTPDEKATIEKMLYDEGYGTDMTGVKSFLLDCCKEDAVNETVEPSSTLGEFIIKNPDIVIDAGKRLGNALRAGLRINKKPVR